ncbi:MAG TPA: Hsp20/alpha crystallin family protein [Gaiellales bacterium]|jgi:HSP20 family protein|nr:Hsp20/alpha crystallin family protein [Gaiellales bacterium]
MNTTLTRRDPLLADLDAMTDSFERMFGLRAAPGGLRGFLPPVDIWEDDHQVVIELDVPGCDAGNLSAEAVDGQLVVTGERTASAGASRRYRSERWQGRFVRSFTLPQGVDGGSITADYEDGVLRVQLPKPEERRGHGRSTSVTDRRRSAPSSGGAGIDPRQGGDPAGVAGDRSPPASDDHGEGLCSSHA